MRRRWARCGGLWARRWARRDGHAGRQVDKATSAQRDINTGPSIGNWHLTGRYLPWQVHYLYLPDSKLCVICQ